MLRHEGILTAGPSRRSLDAYDRGALSGAMRPKRLRVSDAAGDAFPEFGLIYQDSDNKTNIK